MAPRSSGRRPHQLKLQHQPSTLATDGDGSRLGEYETYAEVFGSVEPATAQRLEKLTLSGAIGSASHIVSVPFVEGVVLQDRVLFLGRKLDVVGYADPEERHIELVLVCQEIKE